MSRNTARRASAKQVALLLDAFRNSFWLSDGSASIVAQALSEYNGIFVINGLEAEYSLVDDETTIKLEIKLR